jgi:hypothetical protein
VFGKCDRAFHIAGGLYGGRDIHTSDFRAVRLVMPVDN